MRAVGPHIENREADRREHEYDRGPGGEASEHVGRGAWPECGLGALATECAGKIGRAALLEQDYTDEEQAHDYVEGDDEVEKNLHAFNCFLGTPPAFQLRRGGRIFFGAEEGT